MPRASILAFPIPQESNDEPASRLRRCGAVALGLNELIGLAIGPQMAARFAAAGDRWNDFLTIDYRELRAMDINDDEAVVFLASIELARRFAKKKALTNWDLGKPDLVAQYLILRYYRSDQEVVGALFLDARQRLIVDEVLYRGTLKRTSLEPRALLRRALALHASAFILASSAESVGEFAIGEVAERMV